MSASAFGELTVIVNPNAGGGAVREQVPALEEALAAHGLPYELHLSGTASEATRRARTALEAGGRYVVAVGGDGTVQAVLNGFFDDGHPLVEQPVLGVVGAGSGCDLLRTFGLPAGTEDAVSHLAGENVYPFDVMKVVTTGAGGERLTRYAHNLAEVGLGASVTWRRRRLPAWTGRARDFLGFWIALASSRTSRVTVEADTKAYEGSAFNVVVANAQFTNGGLRLSPRSFPGDGILDVLVFTGPRSDALTMLPRIFRHGDHVPDPHIRELRAKIRVAVDADRSLLVVADGNELGRTPATFQIVPRQVLLKL
ncbi:MAG TPA: diacylglycerol kinase family protein [Actinomycetota bacterium]|jgi:diacylglycerol kinase family enzyme|nr:diacylglycerol kinase family protein [Actinomycetota bacterium]